MNVAINKMWAVAGLTLITQWTPASLTAQAATPKADVAELSRLLLDLSYLPGFRVDDLFARGLDAIDKDPANPLTEELASRLLVVAGRTDSSPKNWSRVQSLAEDSRLHGLTRLLLRSAVARRLKVQDKSDAATKISPRGEYVLNALAIGPFGDSYGDGFGRVEAPEFAEPALGAKYGGRFGDDVRWRSIQSRRESTLLELAPRGLGSKSRGTHYALVQLQSADTKAVWLHLTCSGSFESWWNDARSAAMHRGVDRGPTRTFVPVVLRKGWNRLLFKCASSSVSNFSLRVVDELGNSFIGDGVDFEKGDAIHPIAPPPEVDIAAPGTFLDATAWLRTKLPSSDDPAVRAAIGNLLARRGFGDTGLGLTQSAYRESSKSLRLRVAHMATWRLARHIPPDVRRSALRSLMKDLDEKSAQEHAWLFMTYVDQLYADDEKEKSLRVLNARLASNPDEVWTLDRKWKQLRGLRWNGEARRVLHKLANVAPQPRTYARSIASSVEAEGDPRRALDLVEKALELRPGDTSLLQKALSLAKKSGLEDRVDALLARRWKNDPGSLAARNARAVVLADRQQHEQALAILESIRKETPQNADLLERMARYSYRRGDDEAAKKRIDEALALRPERHAMRAWRDRLEGRARYTELEPWRLDVDAAVSSFEERDEDRAAPSTLVLDQMVIRVYPDGSQMEETHILKRLNDRRGVEQNEAAEQAANADELLTLRTITSDGRSWSPHRVAGSFTMPRRAPGVFIEERYRNLKSSNGLNPLDFVTFFFRGVDRPYRFSRLVVVLPANHDLGDFVLRNFPEESVQVQDLGDLKAYVFLRENETPIKPEDAMPTVDEIAPWVTFGRDSEIAPALRSWKNQFASLTIPYAEIRAKAAELCRGKKSQVARARAIHDFVHAHAPDASQRAGSPQPVSILMKREGPRFWLELALLRAVDIPWTPAVVRPYSAETDPDPEPALRRWSRWPARGAIVKPRDGEPYWLMLGAPRWQPFGELPSHFGNSPTAGCPYILLEGDVGVPGTLDGTGERELAEFTVRANAILRDGNAFVRATVTLPGSPGRVLKEQVRTMPTHQRKLIGQQLAGYFFRGTLQFQKVEFVDLDKPSARFIMRFDMTRSRALRARGDEKILAPLLPIRTYTRIFGGRGDRKFPLVSKRIMVDDWQITIDPGEHRFVDVPRGQYLEHDLLTWTTSYARRGNAIVMRRKASLRPGRVEPEAYSDFLKLCRQIDGAESRSITLR